MGHRHSAGTAAAHTLAIAVACLALASGCAGRPAPTATPVSVAGSTQTTEPAPGPTGPTSVPDPEPPPPPAPEPPDPGPAPAPEPAPAPGSPIDVPSIPGKHLPMDEVGGGIEELFIEACGGELCVTLEFGDGECFVGYDPPTQAKRGSTVKVLTESEAECDEANGLGSPIDVPTIPDKHLPMDEVGPGIEGLFVAACGGEELCVTLEYGDGACFVGYDPSTQARRGSTVTVLTESQEECDEANGLGSESGTDGSTDGSSGSGTDGGSADTGQPDGNASG